MCHPERSSFVILSPRQATTGRIVVIPTEGSIGMMRILRRAQDDKGRDDKSHPKGRLDT